jgi:hypothetical protein
MIFRRNTQQIGNMSIFRFYFDVTIILLFSLSFTLSYIYRGIFCKVTAWTRVHRKPTVVPLLKNLATFIDPDDSLLCSEGTATCIYPEPDESNPYHPCFFKIHVNTIGHVLRSDVQVTFCVPINLSYISPS